VSGRTCRDERLGASAAVDVSTAVDVVDVATAVDAVAAVDVIRTGCCTNSPY
jgi:hypothetical protein